MNIIIIENPVVNAITWWRFLRPLRVMQEQNPGKYNIKMTRKLDAADLFFTDLFILSRPNDKDTLELVKRIKQAGKAKIILDIDDAITNVPQNHDQRAYHDKRAHIAREIFTLTDHFWVTTEQLLYECDALGRGTIIPNAILESDLPKEPSPDRGLWMWRGKAMQKEDVYLAGAEVYEEIKALPKQWIFWGVLPSLDHGNNVQLLEYEDDVQSYFSMLKNLRLNGVWKPLVENQFNDAKSNIAWIEATMSGGVCLTNYAGKKAWEFATNTFPTYQEACDLWAQSCEEIKTNYNLKTTATQRHNSIEALFNQTYL